MTGFNRVILAGNLTRDPQVKYLPNNTAVCEFGMAMNHKWRDKEGNSHEDTCFVNCAAFGRQGEVINQYMSKGKPILVEGRLKYHQWTAQDGSKQSRLSVVVDNFQFLGGPRDGEGGGQRGNYDRGGQSRGPAENRPVDNYGASGAGAAGGGYSSQRESAPSPAPANEYEDSYSAGDAEPPPRNDDIPF